MSKHEFTAFDSLPAPVRQAMTTAVCDFDAREILERCTKYGIDKTIKWLRTSDQKYMRETAFYASRSSQNTTRSSYLALRIKPL